MTPNPEFLPLPVAVGPTARSRTGGEPLTAADVAEHRDLFGVDDETLAVLAEVADAMAHEVDGVIDEFYRRQLQRPDVAAKLGAPGVLDRLRGAQRRYVLDLFAGRCDRAYMERRLRVGRVHEVLGVAPRYYLGALRLLRELIAAALRPHLQAQPARREAVHLALDRLLALDSSLAMDTYIASLLMEVEQANAELRQVNDGLEETVAARTRELEEQARRDPLTGLWNSRALREHLERTLAHARRRGRPLSVMYLDVDEFKAVNDSGGHAAGDRVLRTVGEVLRRACRQEDIPCRYGGDEFCVVAVDADLDQAEALARRLSADFARAEPAVTLSIGLAQAGPRHYDAADALIDRADRKMYQAKRAAGFAIRR